jgi:hypothetical protein
LLGLLAGPALLAPGAALLWWALRPPPAVPVPSQPAGEALSDPRRAYRGPYRNVDPAVRYVGDRQCRGCHPAETQSFGLHPMGRSLRPVKEVATAQQYGQAHHNPFVVFGRQARVERAGERVWHRLAALDDRGERVVELALEAHFALGSGSLGYSYFTERRGYLFQTPVSWFSQKRIWDLSPGFGPDFLPGRKVRGECLYCHANRVQEREGYVDRYESPIFDGYAIGCERCHGPGEVHVRERKAGLPVETKRDYSIVKVAGLEPALREAVCQQCHLEGEVRFPRRGRGLYDFRPGMPLQDFWAVFVHAQEGQERRAVNHVEQMYQSKCFRAGLGDKRMGCVSCHDPHDWVGPERRVAYYRGKCLGCHQERGCSEPLERRRRMGLEDSCIACHMPRRSATDVAHAATTDHRILRSARRAHHGPSQGGPPEVRIVEFYSRQRGPSDSAGSRRDWGLALVQLLGRGKFAPAGHAGDAVHLLESALARASNDVAAWEGKGLALVLARRNNEALAAFQAVLRRMPRHENALALAALVAEQNGDVELALRYGRRLVAVNPHNPSYHRRLAKLLVRTGAVAEADQHVRASLRLDPFSVPARELQVTLLARAGKKAEGRAALETLRRLRPANLAELEARLKPLLGK